MKLFKLPLVLLALAVSACGPIKDYKNARNMEKERDQLVKDINDQGSYLNSKYSVNISPAKGNVLFFSVNWTKYVDAERKDIRNHLNSIRSKIARVREIGLHKDMKIEKNLGDLISMDIRASMALSSLDSFERTSSERLKLESTANWAP